MQVQQNIPAEHVANRDYTATKESLIEEYSQPKPALFEKMVCDGGIRYTTPKQYLRDITRIGNKLKLTEEYLKIKFISSLPAVIKAGVAGHSDKLNLEDLAGLAETIQSYQIKSHSVNNVIQPVHNNLDN